MKTVRVLEHGESALVDAAKRVRSAGLMPVLTLRYDPENKLDEHRVERIANAYLHEGHDYFVLDFNNSPTVGLEVALPGGVVLLMEIPRQMLWRLDRREGGYRE